MYNQHTVNQWVTAATVSMQSDSPLDPSSDHDRQSPSITTRPTNQRINFNPASDCSDDGYSDDETNDFMVRHGVNRQPSDQTTNPNHQPIKDHVQNEIINQSNNHSNNDSVDTSSHTTASLCVDACDSGLQSRSLIDASFYQLLNHMPKSNKMPLRRASSQANHSQQSHVKYPKKPSADQSNTPETANRSITHSPRQNPPRPIHCSTYDRQNGDDYYDRDDGCDCRYCSYFNQDVSALANNPSTSHHKRPQEYHPTSDQPTQQPLSGGSMDSGSSDSYADSDTQSILSTDSDQSSGSD